MKKEEKNCFLSFFKKAKIKNTKKENEQETLERIEELLRLKKDFNTKDLIAVKYEFISSVDDGEGYGPRCFRNDMYYVALKINEKTVYDILTGNILEFESSSMYFDVPFVIEQKSIEEFPSIAMFLKNETLNKWRILEIYNTINSNALSFFQIENDIEMDEEKIFLVTQNYCDGEVKSIVGYTTNENEVENFVKGENKSLAKGDNYLYSYVLIEEIE